MGKGQKKRTSYWFKRRLRGICQSTALLIFLGLFFAAVFCPAPVHAQSADIAAFPQSYQSALEALKASHPTWTFVPVYVSHDWNTVVAKEMQNGRSLVENSSDNWKEEGAYDQGRWFYASKEILEYYMDPRNALTEDRIFQFEQLSFNEEYHTEEGLKAFLDNTFMGKGALVPNTVMTYPFLIYACGKHEDVRTSPFHLAARIFQEQGSGGSPLISGNWEGCNGIYKGYYNYFNIGATGNTNAEIIENGLKYAKEKWGKEIKDDSGKVIATDQGAYNAIFEGSKFVAKNYIKAGQDTLYLQKYDLVSASICTHQYMQNIAAPTSEAKKIRNLYNSANTLGSPFVFHIPVYQNMPAQACKEPTSSTNIVLNIPTDMTVTKVRVDGVEYEGANYYDYSSKIRRLVVTMPDGNRRKASIEIKDANGNVTRGLYWNLTYQQTYYVATSGAKEALNNDIYLVLPDSIKPTEIWLDGMTYAATLEGVWAKVTAGDANARTAIAYIYDENGTPKDMYVWTLAYGEDGYMATLQTQLQGLISTCDFSARLQDKIGIRYITGIREQLRETLLGSGVDGYRLKEYGTITMPSAARATGPMLKGAANTVSGVSYGTAKDGSAMDAVFKSENGMLYFSNVLTDLTWEHCKTEFAFRSYLILEKNGQEITLYGPITVRSLYSVAQEMLAKGAYEGDAERQRLEKLIEKTDAQ